MDKKTGRKYTVDSEYLGGRIVGDFFLFKK